MAGDGDELAGIKRRERRGSPGVLVEVALPLLGAETWSAQLSQPSTLMPASPPPLPQPPGGAEEGWWTGGLAHGLDLDRIRMIRFSHCA